MSKSFIDFGDTDYSWLEALIPDGTPILNADNIFNYSFSGGLPPFIHPDDYEQWAQLTLPVVDGKDKINVTKEVAKKVNDFWRCSIRGLPHVKCTCGANSLGYTTHSDWCDGK